MRTPLEAGISGEGRIGIFIRSRRDSRHPGQTSGPKRLWSRVLGEGYSSIVVDDDSLYTMYREEDDEIIVCLSAGSGETRWEHRYSAPLLEDMNYGTWLKQGGAGPYATPLLLGGNLYAVGSTGKFHVLDRATGKSRVVPQPG